MKTMDDACKLQCWQCAMEKQTLDISPWDGIPAADILQQKERKSKWHCLNTRLDENVPAGSTDFFIYNLRDVREELIDTRKDGLMARCQEQNRCYRRAMYEETHVLQRQKKKKKKKKYSCDLQISFLYCHSAVYYWARLLMKIIWCLIRLLLFVPFQVN